MAEKLVYFLSDAHLGSRAIGDPRAHEKKLVSFLDSIKDKAAAIYLLGDMFDFWFEYRTVVPKGHVRFLGKIAEIADSGMEVHFFAGNHDMWTFGYLADELGINVHTKRLMQNITIATMLYFCESTSASCSAIPSAINKRVPY